MPDELSGVLSTPVYAEPLTVRHVAAGDAATVAAAVARAQSAEGWTATVSPPGDRTALDSGDVVVLWGLAAGSARTELAGRRTTVLVLDEADVRSVLTRPARWVREARAARDTNLLLLPAGLAERYTRFGPPVPLAHRPAGLPDADAVTLLSAWVARAYAYGRLPG